MCIHLKSVAPPIAKVLAAQQIEILIFCAGNNMIISGATDYKAKAMSSELVGRLEEQRILNSIYRSNQAEFLAIYGRRRIGKTFLIKKYFTSHKANFFSITGIQNADTATQIERFIIEIGNIFYKGATLKPVKDWYGAFDQLHEAINKNVSARQKVVIFLDEFPWMAGHRSKLLSVLEYFWNQHWSLDKRIKLIICGSSASWIIKKIINNKGGLHNRITKKIHLTPFKLSECKNYLSSKGIKLQNNKILELYMVTGGVPYYLASVEKGYSAVQIIEKIAFKKDSILFKEFDNLLSSLFEEAEQYADLLRIIAKCRYGLGQEEILKKAKLSRGGRAGDKLKELEDAGFITSFVPYLHMKRGIYYRVIDEYTLFYFKWIEPIRKTLEKESAPKGYWERMHESPAWSSWSGYAFESICYKHIAEIRNKLEIGANAIAYTWRYIPSTKSAEQGAQIDLLFDRADDAVTLCEIKYTDKPFVIDKKYAKELLAKQEIFVSRTKTEKQILTALISAAGLKQNIYADDVINNVITADDLF